MRRPVLCLENFSTSELAATRPAPLRKRDEEELARTAADCTFWQHAQQRGDVSAEAVRDLQAAESRIEILCSFALVQLVRVSLRDVYGVDRMRRGAFNEAKIYSTSMYQSALIGALKIAQKCNWIPHILPPAPDREPPPHPFELPQKCGRDEHLARVRRHSSASSASSSVHSLEKIAEINEALEKEADSSLQPLVCDQASSQQPPPKAQLEVPEQVFYDD